jgi:signal transduction histidine kinase/ligand-binding sensor domain-containing protein
MSADCVRCLVGRGLAAFSFLIAWCPCAFALNPALDISQYAHTAWRIRDGFTKGVIDAIAQTPDGYLWLGTEFGLLRFDGVRAVPWQPSPGETLPSDWVRALLVSRDGTLWIGTLKGLASWKNGRLTQYPRTAGMSVDALLEQRQGTMWAGGSEVPNGKLCKIEPGSAVVECDGEDGTLGTYVGSLYEDPAGNLWAGASSGLWRWTPGPRTRFADLAALNMARAMIEGDNRAPLIASRAGFQQFVEGKLEKYPVPSVPRGNQLLRDRDGALWIGTGTAGLAHLHEGRTDGFVQSDGLSGDIVTCLFEDREGTIWVATGDGLDRFREFAVATLSVKQGLPTEGVDAVLAAADGGVWLGSPGRLNKWKDGQITVNGGVQLVTSLAQGDRGRTWVATYRGVGYLESGRFVVIGGVPGGIVRAMAVDRSGDLWISHQERGLLRVRGESQVESIPWTKLGQQAFASAVVADQVRGGVWLGFYRGGVAHIAGGEIRARYTAADGLAAGVVNGFHIASDGTLWVAAEGGLSRVKDGRVVTLTSRNALSCDTVHWLTEDDDHSYWLYTACGLMRIARPELEAWAETAENRRAAYGIPAVVFDTSDGVRSHAFGTSSRPAVAKAADGRLWFVPMVGGVSVIDPHHLPRNNLSPPVHVEQIIADRKTYDVMSAANNQVRLPPLVRDLQIDYTALSLVAPEKMRFRYKLEGWDRDWQDVGTRRQAFYNNLPPRAYRFSVKASNNSGVWNEAGAFVDFAVAPAYYQTVWFRVSVVAFVLLSLAALYRLRLRRAARQFNLTLEARVSERTRIARELHDTLLQSFHGLLLRFQAVAYQLPEGADARKQLESAIDQAARAITEGRDAVQGLRASTIVTNDLAPALRTLGDELASHEARQPKGAVFEVEVEGVPRDLHPILRDEIYRVAGEALRNAFRHAHAMRIEVEIRYDDRYLRVRVRDDGKGIDAHVLDGGGSTGHYGVAGMYERASLIGGKLTVWSELESGTEVELTVPASVAYAKSSVDPPPVLSGTGM